MPKRRGFTLAEIMLALVATSVVCGAVYRMLLSAQRLSRAQAQQIGLQSALRTGSLVVLNELRELSTVPGGTPDQNDILSIASGAITYRAMRGIGFLCAAPTGSEIRVARSSFAGLRDPESTRDAVYVFIEATPDTDTDDAWLRLPIVGVSPAAACPGGSGPGITLSIPPTPAVIGLEVGTPIRISEVMELRLYRSEGRSWLGARSVSAGEVIQPVTGPLSDRDGLQLEYLDAAGLPTAEVRAVKSIRVTLQADFGNPEDIAVRGTGGGKQIITQVTLRNSLRR